MRVGQVTGSLPLHEHERLAAKPGFKPILFRTAAADGAMLEAYQKAVVKWTQRDRCAACPVA